MKLKQLTQSYLKDSVITVLKYIIIYIREVKQIKMNPLQIFCWPTKLENTDRWLSAWFLGETLSFLLKGDIPIWEELMLF